MSPSTPRDPGALLWDARRAAGLVDEFIPDLPRLVAFRNILIHGYALVDNELVWDAATGRLPELLRLLDELLTGP